MSFMTDRTYGAKPFRLQCVTSYGDYGVISPIHLQFASRAEGETVAARYRARECVTGKTYHVIKVNKYGYVVPSQEQ